MSFHTPRIDDVEGQSDALGLRSMVISHTSIACMRVTLKKPRLTAEMPALMTYPINRFSLPFPKMRLTLSGARSTFRLNHVTCRVDRDDSSVWCCADSRNRTFRNRTFSYPRNYPLRCAR